LAVFAVSFLVVRFVGSPLVDKFGGRLVVASSVSVEAVALAGLAAAGGPVDALLFTALAGFGLALVYPACVAMTLDRVRGLRPGVSMGVMTSFWDLGVLAAGPAGGLVAEQLGFQAAFCLAAGTAIGCVIVCLTVPRRAASRR
jgi:MFS family permease